MAQYLTCLEEIFTKKKIVSLKIGNILLDSCSDQLVKLVQSQLFMETLTLNHCFEQEYSIYTLIKETVHVGCAICITTLKQVNDDLEDYIRKVKKNTKQIYVHTGIMRAFAYSLVAPEPLSPHMRKYGIKFNK